MQNTELLDEYFARFDAISERYAGTTGDFADDDEWQEDIASERLAYEAQREADELPPADPEDILF